MTQSQAKPTKPAKKRIAVFFDTNFLFVSDKREILSGFFKDFTSRFAEVLDCGLFLPDTVLMELKYQAAKVAIDAATSLESKCKFINELTRLTVQPHLTQSNSQVTTNDLTQAIDKIYNDVVKKYGIQVLPLPHEKLNIVDIQKHSTNRIGIFEEIRTEVDGKTTQVGEKGFRDFLIQKTIEFTFETIAGYEGYVILTGDKLLSSILAKIKNPHGIKIEVLSSTQDAFSYFNGILTSVNREWIKRLLPLATTQFVNSTGNTGLWDTKAREELIAKFKSKIDALQPDNLDRLLGKWDKGSSQWTYSQSQYDSKTGDKYVWTNYMEFSQKFGRVEQPQGSNDFAVLGWKYPEYTHSARSIYFQNPEPILHEIIKTLKFQIQWEANVDDNADFSNLAILKIEMLPD